MCKSWHDASVAPKRTLPTLAEIERDLAELSRRRAEMDRAIRRLEQIAAWLRYRANRRASRTADGTGRKVNLTTYCRAALRMHAPRGLTPTELRDVLVAGGLDFSRYSNGQATLHTVLKRLVHQGEATVAVDGDGVRRYAIREARVLVLTREELESEEFLKRLLAAESPDAIADLINARRTPVKNR